MCDLCSGLASWQALVATARCWPSLNPHGAVGHLFSEGDDCEGLLLLGEEDTRFSWRSAPAWA